MISTRRKQGSWRGGLFIGTVQGNFIAKPRFEFNIVYWERWNIELM
jgi:hypothetical protein